MDAGEVEIALAAPDERSLIEGLFQFYAYDFSELEPADSEDFEPGPDGRFPPYAWMGRYWSDPSRTPLIIRWRGLTAGFALVNAMTHSGQPVEHNMAEFFVMRKHRRRGVAKAAVRAILTRLPGAWEVAAAERNHAARAFWPAAVAATPGVRDLVTLQGDGVNWTGPILRFTVAP